MKIDHIAIETDEPDQAAKWYCKEFGAKIVYSDSTWAAIQFENIKLAFVKPSQHPRHFAFEVDSFSKEEKIIQHRDGSNSVYKTDPWGNAYELINYKLEKK